MDGLLAFIIGMLILTAIGLEMARRWLDKQEKMDKQIEDYKKDPP